eukprot:CAMPEP_0170636992 /NCGR_PEP_ID=MMETSP0224-20130122/38148_1 /TAXON_ID=285029 /ORGANISM="Togula jolla, Strain CCCM 725" /LENGTH=895 /DNA_ID=CAMNT_0010966791 /DNA_START=76 /DNA_END=2761 /DNA_ORIENTATION=+
MGGGASKKALGTKGPVALLPPSSAQVKTCSPELSETDKAEVLAVLGKARCPRLKVGGWALKRLASEFGRDLRAFFGQVLQGWETWFGGPFIVLSGEAAVFMHSGGDTVVDDECIVATLQKHDCFGWNGEHFEKQALTDWMECQPRVVVQGTGTVLRVARLLEDPVKISSMHSSTKAFNDGGSRTLAKHLASKHLEMPQFTKVLSDRSPRTLFEELHDLLGDFWNSTSASKGGIMNLPGGFFKAHFMIALWGPFIDQLDDHQDEIRSRKEQNFRVHDRFPLQGRQIRGLCQQCQQFTDIWYGTDRGGNLSAVYGWFVQAMDAAGITAYHYEDIPIERASDRWTAAVSGTARANALKDKGKAELSYQAAGGMPQKQGRSAIDNTVLRNMFTPVEAREILVGKVLRKVLCAFLSLRQRVMLKRVAEHLRMDLYSLGCKDNSSRAHRLVRNILKSIPKSELDVMGIDSKSWCFQGLLRRGSVLAGYGQMLPEHQMVLWDTLRKLLNYSEEEADANPDSEDIFERFVAWCRDHPGEFFENSKEMHITVKISGMFSRRIIPIKRSAMERYTLAKYFPLSWCRTQPLWGVFATGPFQVRPAGIPEASNVRANECPYAPLHGMALSAGGFASDSRCLDPRNVQPNGYSFLMELQWVRDPSANIENWYLTDIEKIAWEALKLNPHGPKDSMLLGERFVVVGQNPKVGSSIKQTQHTQLCEGSVSDFPVLSLSTNPRFSRKLDGTIDVVDIETLDGGKDKGMFIKILTQQPTGFGVLSFLVNLRLRLLKKFGGGERLDFLSITMSDERGGFLILFGPIPQLDKLTNDHPDLASWANPMTGETTLTAGLEEARIDFGKGLGHFLVAKPALQEQLLISGEEFMRRLWVFNRVPGCREEVSAFLEEQQ